MSTYRCLFSSVARLVARPLARPSALPVRAAQSITAQRFAAAFSTSAAKSHGHVHKPKPGEELHITFVDKDGVEHAFEVAEGDNLLDIAQANDLEMEGACGGSCACSTCHVIVTDEAFYDNMPEPDDDENDMLDLAFGLTETSRLGCQVKMTKALDGLKVKLPTMTRNLQASDFN
ncbi:hypothetical protein TD95_001282 [Thielaviopsis punctulata]|uniref:2Fe-2S ferredoxin-type domain-containing protein n=1 Tax=Thielaviopsis punctulata TaxID=72032 RepID=A0A0F4ZD26_9PEZI|nr:hypothetical protein TD95_001282 [Thielaviopsis punctulata]